jgi:type I restriction enzyme S subunit
VIANDLLIAGLGDDRHPAGRACVAPLGIAPAMVKADCFRFRLKQSQVVPYFAALHCTATAESASAVLSTGSTRQRTNLYSTAARAVALPSVLEQAAIVRFLSYFNRRIQRYIRAKKKLIALLNEQKQAVIHRAVTRGLDANARLKPSGVEWLGEVPENWATVRLGRLIGLTTGFPFKSEGFSLCETDVRLLRGINIGPGRVRWETVVYWPASGSGDFADYQLREGDLVFGMDRPIISGGVRVAKISTADLPALLLQRVARIRPHAELDADFALLVLSGKSFVDYLTPIFTGISVPHVSPDQISSFRIALPNRIEQPEIVKWLKTGTTTLDTSIESAQREIDLLYEYRTRLIADVVTGKLDVREAAARLPEEIEAALDEGEALAEDEDGSESEEEAVA